MQHWALCCSRLRLDARHVRSHALCVCRQLELEASERARFEAERTEELRLKRERQQRERAEREKAVSCPPPGVLVKHRVVCLICIIGSRQQVKGSFQPMHF